MADQVTPNFKLNLPEFDKRFYDQELNDNFSIIDAVIKTYLDLSNVQGVWANSTAYSVGDKLIDATAGVVYECVISHVSAASPTTFLQDRMARSTFWTAPSIPARGLGNWQTGTDYEPGDFVVANGTLYAVCIASNTSGATFLGDSVFWDILIDVSSVPALPSFVGHNGQYARVKSDASNLEYVTAGTIGVDIGLGTLAFQSGVLGSISSQDAGNVTITGGHITGITDIAIADGGTGASTAANARSNLNLGSAALLTAGTAANNAVQLTAAAKLPAVDGSLLTNLPNVADTFYDSGEQTITAGGLLTLAHGLGVMPHNIEVWARCKTNDGAYVVGEEIQLSTYNVGSGFGTNRGTSIRRDTTNILVRTGSGGISYLDATAGTDTNLTLGSWKYLIRARNY